MKKIQKIKKIWKKYAKKKTIIKMRETTKAVDNLSIFGPTNLELLFFETIPS